MPYSLGVFIVHTCDINFCLKYGVQWVGGLVGLLWDSDWKIIDFGFRICIPFYEQEKPWVDMFELFIGFLYGKPNDWKIYARNSFSKFDLFRMCPVWLKDKQKVTISVAVLYCCMMVHCKEIRCPRLGSTL